MKVKMINVSFRVIGIYFGRDAVAASGGAPSSPGSVTGEVVVAVPENPSVYQIMLEVALKANTGGVPGVDAFTFDPLFPSSSDTMKSVAVSYTTNPITIGGVSLPRGDYQLQDAPGDVESTFQYYIMSPQTITFPDGTTRRQYIQKNANNTSKKFAEKPDVQIENGDAVWWRQVNIRTVPASSPVLRSRLVMTREMFARKSIDQMLQISEQMRTF